MALGLNDREAAKIAGVSHQAISKARRAGRLTMLADKTVAVAEVERWLAGRRTPRGGNHTVVAAPVVEAGNADGETARKARAAFEVTVGPHGLYVDRQAAELARDSYAARLKQLEYQERSGKLLAEDAVKQSIARCCAKVRTAILSVPSEHAPAIARLKNPSEVQALLLRVLTEALEALAEDFGPAPPGVTH